MLVSKNALPLIDVVAVEDKSCWQGALQLSQTLQRFFPAAVATHFKGFLPRDSNLDVVALFQCKRLYDCGRQANRKTISPLRNLHRPPWIYILNCISIRELMQ